MSAAGELRRRDGQRLHHARRARRCPSTTRATPAACACSTSAASGSPSSPWTWASTPARSACRGLGRSGSGSRTWSSARRTPIRGRGREHAAFFETRITEAVESAVTGLFPAADLRRASELPAARGSTAWLRARTATPASPGSATTTTRPRIPSGIPFGPVVPGGWRHQGRGHGGPPARRRDEWRLPRGRGLPELRRLGRRPRRGDAEGGGGLRRPGTGLFIQGAGGNIESLIISSRRTGPDDLLQTDYGTISGVGGLLAQRGRSSSPGRWEPAVAKRRPSAP